MGISKAAIYSSAVILAMAMGGPARAQKGPPATAPGQFMKSPSATGTTGHGASEYSPGFKLKEFKTINEAPGASGLGGVSGQKLAPGHTIAPPKQPQ